MMKQMKYKTGSWMLIAMLLLPMTPVQAATMEEKMPVLLSETAEEGESSSYSGVEIYDDPVTMYARNDGVILFKDIDETAGKIESLSKLKKDTKVKVLGKGLFQYEQIYIVEYNSKRGFMFPDSLKKGATSNVSVKKKPVSITVNQATTKNVAKIHDNLSVTNAVIIKMSGSKTKAEKTIKELQKKIAAYNGFGVIFQHGRIKKDGKNWKVFINRDQARLYCQSEEATENIYFQAKDHLQYQFHYYKEVCQREKDLYERIYKAFGECDDENFSKKLKSGSGDSYIDTDVFSWVTFQHRYVQRAVAYRTLIEEKKSMAECSDVEKIIIMGYSEYFSAGLASWKRATIKMDYNSKNAGSYGTYDADWKRMKALKEGKLKGVCQDFAEFEVLLTKQWGIQAWVNDSQDINHAWAVMKLKNSKGKIIWMPFDYEIGPSSLFDLPATVKEFGRTTVNRKYKIALQGIKGAPKKKNFTAKDLN